MNNRQNWESEDFELEAEFDDISGHLQAGQVSVPKVPGRLDRRIRSHAKYQAGEDLSQNWLFGRAPQLGLAASLLFAIGVYFVVGVEQHRLGKDSLLDSSPFPVESKAPGVSESNWIKVGFVVNGLGRATKLTIIKSCIRESVDDKCRSGAEYQDYVFRQLKDRTFQTSGYSETVIYIPLTPPIPKKHEGSIV
ncbi:MAG: hypothetical protein VB957_09735 [Pseudomonadales bacterium]